VKLAAGRSGASVGPGRALLALAVAATAVSCGAPSSAPPPAGGPAAPPPDTSPEEGDTDLGQGEGDLGEGDLGEGDVVEPGGDEPDPGAGSGDAETDDEETDGGTTTQDETEQGRGSRTVAWILGLGPSAPAGPSSFRAYALLERGDCEGLLDRFDASHPEALQLGAAEDLYRATALACLAATGARADLWDDAGALAARAGAGTSSCLDLAARAVLDDLLVLGRADQTTPIEPGPVEERHAPPCPSITSVEPGTGAAGTVVTIRGQHLDRVEAIELRRRDADQADERGSAVTSLEGDTLAAARVGSDTITLEVPGDAAPGPLCLILRAVPDWDADAAPFTLEPSVPEGSDGSDEQGEGEPAPTGQPSPCPPPP
jgi:hypothetical protein